MPQDMLINVSEGEECRIAILEDGRLEELYMERTSATSHVGNIYKGRVTNVEASIQAAFIDFGLGRNGFLHISDLMPEYFGEHGDDMHESVGHKISRRDRPPIQKCLRRGDEIIVQIIKEGIGTKGPTLTTYLSIPGRILVMMPGMGKMGVSKKIEDDTERRRLRQILDSLKPPKDVGFIIRTAGIGKSKADIERDLKYLVRLLENIEKKRTSGSGPVELYTEGDLITRTVRDLFTNDIERIVVDNEQVAEQLKDFIRIALPRTKNRVELYDGPVPLFHKFNIESEIELMHSRHVPLPSGGSLVIDSTEAIVAIDVNSGKSREHADAEMMAFNTDMEAAEEIPRQLKLRDLGGVIICDFIDLRFERHRRELEQRLEENMNRDRAKTKVLRMSQFGIIELTRQRMRPSLKRSIYSDCPHCRGSGLVKTPESMTLDVMRRLALAIHDERVQAVDLWVCADVSAYLQNRKRAALTALEADTGKRITIRINPALALDEAKFDCYDEREGLVTIEALQGPGTAQKESSRGGRRSRRGGRNRSGRPQQQLPAPRGQQSAPINGGELFDEEDVDRDDDRDSADSEAAGGHDFESAEGEDQRDSRQRDDDWQERRPQQGRSDQRREGRNDQRNQPQRNDRRGDGRDNRDSRDNRGDGRRDDRNQGRGDNRRDDNRQDTRRDDRNQGRGDNRRDDNRRDDQPRDDRGQGRGDSRRDENRREDQPRNDRGQGRGDSRRGDNRRDENRQDNRGDNRAGNRNDGRRDNRDDRNRDRNRRDELSEVPSDQLPPDETLPTHQTEDAPEPGNELYPEQSDRGGQGQLGDQGDATRRRRRRRRGGRGRRGRGNGGGENAEFQQSAPAGDINRYANERRPDAYADSDPEAEFETEAEVVSGGYERPALGYDDRSDDARDDRDLSMNARHEDVVAYAAEESIEDRYEIPSDATEPASVEPPAPSVAVTDVDAPVIEEPAAETSPVEEEKPAKKKRSTRAKATTAKPKATTTTRTRRSKKSGDAAQPADGGPSPAEPVKDATGDAAEATKPARSRSATSRARGAAKATADSHLIKNDDELDAVEHLEERPRRPRSFVDLDSIPDDLD